VIAYVMHSQKLPYVLAHDLLKKIRPIIDPNPAFKRQLEIFERWTMNVDTSLQGPILPSPIPPSDFIPSIPQSDAILPITPSDTTENDSPPLSSAISSVVELHNKGVDSLLDQWPPGMRQLIYNLEFVTRIVKAHYRVQGGNDPTTIFKEEIYQKYLSTMQARPVPIIIPKDEPKEDDEHKEKENPFVSTGDHVVWVWNCGKCGRHLFTPLNVIHVGSDNIDIELMAWMEDLCELKGELLCPNSRCNATLGFYDKKHVQVQERHVPVYRLLQKNLIKTDVQINV